MVKQVQKEIEDDLIGQMDMQLMYHLKMSQATIDCMDLEEWVRAWCHLKHVRDEEAKEKPK